jgi:hypothetical protein
VPGWAKNKNEDDGREAIITVLNYGRPGNTFTHTASRRSLNVGIESADTTEAGNLFQEFTTLVEKKFARVRVIARSFSSLKSCPRSLGAFLSLNKGGPLDDVLEKPLRILKVSIRSPLSLRLFSENKFNSLRRSSYASSLTRVNHRVKRRCTFSSMLMSLLR